MKQETIQSMQRRDCSNLRTESMPDAAHGGRKKYRIRIIEIELKKRGG